LNLLVRADSSPTVGAGHVLRCLALGQACLERQGTVAFAIPEPASPIFTRLTDVDVVSLPPASEASTADADATGGIARSRNADWVVLDGYRFDDAYQSRVKRCGARLLVLDDFGHAEHSAADVVLNQNLHAAATRYEPAHEPRDLLLGPRYALLRREFAPWRDHPREIPDRASKILVTLGGGETGEVLARVLESLAALDRPELDVRCLIGPLAAKTPELARLSEQADFRLALETAGTEMPELMAWADLAVAAGGSTCWELAFMGLPTLMIAHNAHQVRIATSVEEAGAALYAGGGDDVRRRHLSTLLTELLDNAGLRGRMSRLGRELVDGRGASRVIRELESRLDPGEA
jgi:UDP-2,4-diacetamido-2,4,6-trideoxy-beta-L-altropyranose hydrolase